jgi:hypothetical protein
MVEEDPNIELSLKNLDHSSIPATPDHLVSNGIGLQIFLRAGRNLQKLPHQTVGEQTGPAVMSCGAAIAMFGLPDAPGKDWRQKNEPSADSLAGKMAQMKVTGATAAADKPEPLTEYDYRQQFEWPRPTVPLLSEDKQWALFGSKKHMADVAILARQYCKLVAEKEALESKGNGESSATISAGSQSSTDATDSEEGWPSVEQLDWAGFTNWVFRCKQTDKLFGRETLPSWRAEREKRLRTLTAQLKAWEPPKDFQFRSAANLN